MYKALTIAASDSGGACGIQADIKTFSALGVYATSVITAVTAQNSTGLSASTDIPSDLVVAQAQLVLEDIQPEAIKMGMIGAADNYRQLAELFRTHKTGPLVLDPVVCCYRDCPWVLSDTAVATLQQYMLPLVDVLALSIPDAEVMLRQPITTVAQMSDAAKRLYELGPRFVLLKGGHLEGNPVDVLYDGHGIQELSTQRITTKHDNGSGCVFSSAIAAFLALGFSEYEAIDKARTFMTSLLPHGEPVGKGHGPIHVFHHLWHE
jgi:hydroxymethylpyrimidine/phosphomethylpyrimidine kinase